MWPPFDTSCSPRFAEPMLIGASPAREATTNFAPNVPAGTWRASALPITFVLALPHARDVGAEAAAELDVAIRAWASVACTGWRARFGGARNAIAADDGVNVVLFHDDAWPAELAVGVAAQTVVRTDVDGHYRDADIHLNSKDYRFSLDGTAGTLDLRSVLVHEIGHALGLGHSDDARATMFATGSGLRWRSLEKDDRDGVCRLYPGAGAGDCEATACPAPFVCVARSCQRPGEVRDVCSPCERVLDACEGAGDGSRCVDIGEGASAGRVCGRACSTDQECGGGFRCIDTTAAGDRQCVSDVACRNGSSPCTTNAECKDSTCRAGACVGLPDVSDAGADASPPDAASDGGATVPTGSGGCGCRVTPARSRVSFALEWLAVAAIVTAIARRRR